MPFEEELRNYEYVLKTERLQGSPIHTSEEVQYSSYDMDSGV